MTVPGLDDAIGEALDAIDTTATVAPPVQAAAITTRPAPFITSLRIGDLFRDPAYQRPLNEGRVEEMATAYDPALVGVLDVSDRGEHSLDGRYAVLDGQHRWAMLVVAHTEHEDGHVVCNVHRGLTVADEAALFYELNTGRRQLSGFDRWVARRTSGDLNVLAIEEVLARYDVIVDKAASNRRVSATKALKEIVALGTPTLLDRTLEVSTQVYGITQDALDGSVLAGLAQVLAYYGDQELDVPRLVTTLGGLSARQLRARSIALRDVMEGTAPRLVATVIVDEYNRAPGRRLQRFSDRVPPASKAKPDDSPEARRRRAIKQWAEGNGFGPLSKQGRIPRRIIDAYEAAHAEVAS